MRCTSAHPGAAATSRPAHHLSGFVVDIVRGHLQCIIGHNAQRIENIFSDGTDGVDKALILRIHRFN